MRRAVCVVLLALPSSSRVVAYSMIDAARVQRVASQGTNAALTRYNHVIGGHNVYSMSLGALELDQSCEGRGYTSNALRSLLSCPVILVPGATVYT